MQFLVRKLIPLLAQKYKPFPGRVDAVLAEKAGMILFHITAPSAIRENGDLQWKVCVSTAAELWAVF